MVSEFKPDSPNHRDVSHHCDRFSVSVAKANFEFHDGGFELDDPKVTGRQLLEKAGFRPVEEHLIFQVLENGAIEELRLDEIVELRATGRERFIAFKSDRSFRVEIDGRRFEWGVSRLTGLLAKQMVGAAVLGTGVWLERREKPDRFIEDTDAVDLSENGIERLRTGPVLVLWIESSEFQWSKPTITAEQIAELGGWDVSAGVQQIDLATNEARTLKPGEVVDLQKVNTFAKKIGWRRG